MKLFVNKQHKIASIIGFFVTAPALMAVTSSSFGSFNPKDLGFWLCIANALFITITVDLALVKVLSKHKKKNNRSNDNA